MATSRAQQVGIWIIAITLTVGTLASFVAIVLGNENQQNKTAIDQEAQQKALEEYQKQIDERQKSLEVLPGYEVTTFDSANVTGLKADVLVEGTGAEVKETDTIKASYTGWLSDGKIFDSTKSKDSDDAPVTFPLQNVIAGWTEGLKGKKVGSVVMLTIPADKGYGAAGSPPTIPANAPLRFIVNIHSIEQATTE
jgi:FKBP-type peptidyl-prolyl cis-trans isomerase